jgi:hypothetical protein
MLHLLPLYKNKTALAMRSAVCSLRQLYFLRDIEFRWPDPLHILRLQVKLSGLLQSTSIYFHEGPDKGENQIMFSPKRPRLLARHFCHLEKYPLHQKILFAEHPPHQATRQVSA